MSDLIAQETGWDFSGYASRNYKRVCWDLWWGSTCSQTCHNECTCRTSWYNLDPDGSPRKNRSLPSTTQMVLFEYGPIDGTEKCFNGAFLSPLIPQKN